MAGKEVDLEHPRFCPFKKYTIKKYDTMGVNHVPIEIESYEEFTICIGEDCMLYCYDPTSNTEVCTLGGNPYK